MKMNRSKLNRYPWEDKIFMVQLTFQIMVIHGNSI